MADYADLTPQHLAVRSLCRAADTLQQTRADPTTWFFVILDLHRALNCALVAALSGTAGIGAYPDKLRQEWLAWFEASRTDPELPAPPTDFVLLFSKLLARAERGTPEMNSPLQLTPEQRSDIVKLNKFRSDLEHVKPRSWSLEISGLPRMSTNAARAFAALLQGFAHRLEIEEIEDANAAIAKIQQLEEQQPSLPPKSWNV